MIFIQKILRVMQPYIRMSITILLLSSFSTLSLTRAQSIVGTASVGLLINQLFVELSGVIEDARQAGDYLTVKAAVEMKNTLDTWKSVNQDLLNKTFSQLDQQQSVFFINSQNLLTQIQNKTKSSLENLKEAEVLAGQVVQSIPIVGGKTIIYYSKPTVIPVTSDDKFQFRLSGTNLDEGNLQLFIQGRLVNAITNISTKREYLLNKSSFPRDNRIKVHTVRISFNNPVDGILSRILGRTELEVREISLITLPVNLGEYSLSMTYNENTFEEKIYTSEGIDYELKNRNFKGIAKPPEGWEWDVSKPFNEVETGRDNGRFEKFLYKSASGIEYQGRCDQRKRLDPNPLNGFLPGKVTVAVRGIIRRPKSITHNDKRIGQINWLQDTRLDLPSDNTKISLQIKTFNGQIHEFSESNTSVDEDFYSLQVDSSAIIIKPQIPVNDID